MKKNVIAVFDIGKTNKKILLFDESYKVVLVEEQKFDEIKDDDGFPCDDIDLIEKWMDKTVERLVNHSDFEIKAINFATYGATLMYIGENGKNLTPAYNYLKPMPEDVLAGFYDKYGGVNEFSRKTASPALGMLNSGLQALWLKKKKPSVFSKVQSIVHFPQYLSYLFTGKVTSEYTSIGCHTAMWDFDTKTYHKWISDAGIQLPKPVSNATTYPVDVNGKNIKVGIGIHDSSSSLAPYLTGKPEQFILVSSGTWCIFMNPFNDEPLTAEQLKKDTLCYMSIQQKQVKSSRLFLGHIREVNNKKLADYFNVPEDQFKKVKADETLLQQLIKKSNNKMVFFASGIPADYVDNTINLGQFANYDEAYHQLIIDTTKLAVDALQLVIPKNDQSKAIYISGGFARNEIFVRLLANFFPGKKICTSEIDNSTALGAALVIGEEAFGKPAPLMDLGLKEFKPFNFIITNNR
jgi:sugar (pentulose or hexulose) kinase